MLERVENYNTSLLLRQPQKNDAQERGVTESMPQQPNRSTILKEQIEKGEYRIDTHQTAKKMALYLLGRG